jgi:hypothetical protein
VFFLEEVVDKLVLDRLPLRVFRFFLSPSLPPSIYTHRFFLRFAVSAIRQHIFRSLSHEHHIYIHLRYTKGNDVGTHFTCRSVFTKRAVEISLAMIASILFLLLFISASLKDNKLCSWKSALYRPLTWIPNHLFKYWQCKETFLSITFLLSPCHLKHGMKFDFRSVVYCTKTDPALESHRDYIECNPEKTIPVL